MESGKESVKVDKSRVKWFRNRAVVVIGLLFVGFVFGYYIGYNMGLEKAADILVK